jgi:hypothetical protein
MNEFISSLISAELGLVGVSVPPDRVGDRSPIETRAGGNTAPQQPAPRFEFQDSDRRSALG